MTSVKKFLRIELPVFAVLGLVMAAAFPASAQKSFEEIPVERKEMRLPLEPDSPPFVADWLVCGPFPSIPVKGEVARGRRGGFDFDFLSEVGGEAGAGPVAGQKVRRPDGSTVVWEKRAAQDGILDFVPMFPDQDLDNSVVYAYAVLNRNAAGPVVLSLGTDDGVKVYLNGGLVHDNQTGRALTKDQDQVRVDLRKGPNSLMVKVENFMGGWALALRALTEKQALAFLPEDVSLSIDESSWPNSGGLKVRVLGVERPGMARPMRVAVVAPGGKVMASSSPALDELARFDVGAWPDGPYEVGLWREDSAGLQTYQYLEWYKGVWANQACDILDEADKAPADSDSPRHMRVRVLARLIEARLDADPREKDMTTRPLRSLDGKVLREVHSALMEHGELKLGTDRDARAHGFVRLAWRDPVDDSVQFARAYLPADYDSGKAWPLIVNLHGYNGPNPEYIDWWSVFERHEKMSTRHGVIVVEPMGRYNTGYEGFGEDDVLRAVALAKEKFNVDSDRIYLTGQSMGGGGTWLVGTHNPHVFAAIAPVYGGWDYRVWLKPEEAQAKLKDWERYQLECYSSFAQAESLLTTPVFVLHGDADSTVPADFSRYAVRMLQRWGYDLRYREFPGRGHEQLGAEDQMVDWFLKYRLERDPRQVRLRTGFLRFAKSHWLEVLARGKPFAMIEAKGEILDRSTVRITSENALEIRVSPGRKLVDRDKPLRVIWNGVDTGAHRMANGTVTLAVEGFKPGKLRKTAAVEGPIWLVRNTPYALVVGTSSKDPLMRRLCARFAERQRDEWREWQHADPRILLDTEIRDGDLRRYSLVLIGGPEDNLVTKRFAQDLPLKLDKDGITVGADAFAARDAAVSLAYPNPLNPERYVLVVAANSPSGMYFAGRPDAGFDFCVYDALMPTEEEYFDAVPEVAKGNFDHDWAYRREFVMRRDENGRKISVRMHAPRHAGTDVKTGDLALADVLEDSASGGFADLKRNQNARFGPLRLGRRAYKSGISLEMKAGENKAAYELAGGWKRLRGKVGVEAYKASGEKGGAQAVFVVLGDGKELFRSPAMGPRSKPVSIDADLSGVKTLELAVESQFEAAALPFSLNWAEIRLVR